MAKIYVASSWRNAYYPEVVTKLIEAGHEVYDFRNPPHGQGGFKWQNLDPDFDKWGVKEYKKGLRHPSSELQFKSDLDALNWADTCILVLPCGRSAHTEAGWMKGSGKTTIVYIPVMQEPELMYKLFDLVSDSLDEIISLLKSQPFNTTITSKKNIVKKVINCCRSTKNLIGPFSHEYEEDFDLEYDEDSEDDFCFGNSFLDIVIAQCDRIEHLSIELDCLLEDDEWEFPVQIIQAQTSLEFAIIQLQDIKDRLGVWKTSGHFNSEILNIIEHLDEAIEHLEECLDDSI